MLSNSNRHPGDNKSLNPALAACLRSRYVMPQVSRASERPDPARESMLDELAEITLEVNPDFLHLQDEISDLLSSMTRSNEADFVGCLVRRLAANVGALPASESNHHAYPGGLLEHSLEVGTIATQMLKMTLRHNPFFRVPVEERTLWTRGLTIAALFHDVGKVLDFSCRSQPSGDVWDPGKELMAEFIVRVQAKHREAEFHFGFEKGRGYRHESNGQTLIPRMLPASISDEQCSYAVAAYDSCVQRHDLGRTATVWPLPIFGKLLSDADGISCDEIVPRPLPHLPIEDDGGILPNCN